MLDIKNMRVIEIELHNKCNRSCEFCLLHYHPTGMYTEIDQDVLYKMYLELKNSEFEKRNGLLIFSGFYEPFLQYDLLKSSIELAKQVMPKVKIKVNTNGDHLTKEKLEILEHINELNVMDYDGLKRSPQWFAKTLGLIRFKKNEKFHYYYGEYDAVVKYRYDTISTLEIEDRGGTLPDSVSYSDQDLKWYKDRSIRISPCNEGFVSLALGSDGSVYPCCHVRGHVPFHKEYILGNLYLDSLTEIVKGEVYSTFMNRLKSSNYSEYPQGCRRCNKRIELAEKFRRNANEVI